MATINDKFYKEIRCKNDVCRFLFGYEYIFAGRLAFHCPKCGELSEFIFKHAGTKENKDAMQEYSLKNPEPNLKGGEK